MYFPTIWVGEEQDYFNFLVALDWERNLKSETQIRLLDEDGKESLLDALADSVYQVAGGVAVISATGDLVNRDSWINPYANRVSYNTLSHALKRALEDDSVHTILQAVGTRGGDAEGISSYTDNLKAASKIKPVYSWSGSQMLSAGYWISAPSKKIFGTLMTKVGSIGAIVEARSIHRMLQEAGIDIYVARGGKDKSPLHPAEPISDKAKAKLDEEANQMHGFFLEHVMENRPKLTQATQKKWGEGGTFYGQEAVDVGLIDGLKTLSETIEFLDAKGGKAAGSPGASGTQLSRNYEETSMAKQVILHSPEALARVASGVPLEQEQHEEVETTEPGATAQETPVGDPPAEPGEPPVEGAQAGAAAHNTDLVAYLKSELASANAKLIELQLKHSKLEADLAQAQLDVQATRPALSEAVNRLRIGLGQSAVNMTEMGLHTVGSLAAQYVSLSKEFNERYKVGRQSLEADSTERVPVEERARQIGIHPVKK